MADRQEGDPQAIAENPFPVVVMAASAGGIAALTGVFPAAVAIVQHRAPWAQNVLAHVLADGTFSLTQSKKVHGTRPAAEKLFESAAKSLKERIIGVVLTGVDGDGENGVRIVKEMGGRVIAQDEETSEFFGMPSAAIQTGAVDSILPLHQIAPKLISLVGG